MMDLAKTNLLGAVTSLFILTLCILIFTSRLMNRPTAEYWLGFTFLMCALPLIYLFLTASGLKKPAIYSIQLGCMLAFMAAELLLDYVLKIDFRAVRWMVILYVMLFFAGTGGLIGIAAGAGRWWGIAAIILYLAIAVLAFVQRIITGQ
ncbi:MAG: hypothetical protein ACE5FF_00485 [Saprospiraceae bacterium]